MIRVREMTPAEIAARDDVKVGNGRSQAGIGATLVAPLVGSNHPTKSNKSNTPRTSEMAAGVIHEPGTNGVFDKRAYQREYMRKRRAAKKTAG